MQDVLVHLDPRSLACAAASCRGMRAAMDDPGLWRRCFAALEVDDDPEDCRRAYLDWTAAWRHPPVHEGTARHTYAAVTMALGRELAVAPLEAREYVIYGPDGARQTVLPSMGSAIAGVAIVDEAIITAHVDGHVRTWTPSGTLTQELHEPGACGFMDLAADRRQIVRTAWTPEGLCVLDRGRGATVYAVPLPQMPRSLRLVSEDLLGIVLQGLTAQLWRRDRPECLRSLPYPPSYFGYSPPILTRTRLVAVKANPDFPSSFFTLSLSECGAVPRRVPADVWVCTPAWLIGDLLVHQPSESQVAVADARTGAVLHAWAPHDGAPCEVVAVFRDRLVTWLTIGNDYDLKFWRFGAPPAR